MIQISVIIPAYNREAYVGEAIRSVLAQTLPPEEVIVVDDGSTDRTGEIARSFGKPVRCISQENQGVGGARNTGLGEATGNFIALLDSDDLWTGRKLELQARYLENHPETDMVFSHMKPFVSPEIEWSRVIDTSVVPAANAGALLAPRRVFDIVGLFPVERNIQEFFPWFARAADMGVTHHILPEVLLHRRVHHTNSVNDPNFKRAYLLFLKKRLDQKRGIQ